MHTGNSFKYKKENLMWNLLHKAFKEIIYFKFFYYFGPRICLHSWLEYNQIFNIFLLQQKRYTEVGKRGLLDQIHKLQKEVKDLQYELLTVNERREIQERKYEDRKMKTKVKLMRARWGQDLGD